MHSSSRLISHIQIFGVLSTYVDSCKVTPGHNPLGKYSLKSAGRHRLVSITDETDKFSVEATKVRTAGVTEEGKNQLVV